MINSNDIDIKSLEGLEIFLGYKCNVHCNFCFQKDFRYEYPESIGMNEVVDLLDQGYAEGKRFVIFSGGEPTLDKNLNLYVAHAKKLGFKHIRVHTNGFMFQKYDYLEKLFNSGLSGITLSVHGYKAIHDKITNVDGSFLIITKALINFEKLKGIHNNFVIDTNTVIAKYNSQNLLIIFKFLLKFSISRIQLVYPYSINFPKIKLQEILPEKNDYLYEVNSVLSYMDKNKISNFVIETIPYCLIENQYWKFIDKNFKVTKDDTIPIHYSDPEVPLVQSKMKGEKCKKCKKNEVCFGFSNDYYTLYGDSVFIPII